MTAYLSFFTVSLALLLTGVSVTAISVAFPVITSSFGASLVQAGWILSIYQLVSTASLPLVGKLSDMFGKRLIFTTFLLLFTLGSFLCAIAPNIEMLIVFRVIQGIGSAAVFPIATVIVAETFPNKRQQFIGLISSIYPIGQIVGPNLGGWLVTAFGWRSVFWFNIPVGLVILVLAAIVLKTSGRNAGSIDLVGAGLFGGALFAILSGFSQMGGQNASSWLFSGVLLTAGVGLLFALGRHLSRVKDPIVDWQVLRARPFLAANIYNFIFGACYFGILSFVPLYAVSVYNMSTLNSGLILTPWSIGVMLSSAVTSLCLVRWSYRKPMLVGTAMVAVSLFLLCLEYQSISIIGIKLTTTVILIGILFIAGIGTGIGLPASNNACIELMPNRIASITAVRGMFRNSGGAISIAVISLWLSNVTSIARGFIIVFAGLAIIMLISSPLIFAMPKGPSE